jgi:hypothetical protein
MINVIIKKSTNNNKKYDAYFPDKKISFGAAGYSDFTIHKDPERKNRYIERHKKNENWNNPETAGYLSRFILWNKPTIKESINNLNETNNKYKFKLS